MRYSLNMASRKFCRTDYMLSIKKEYKAKTPEISRSLGFAFYALTL